MLKNLRSRQSLAARLSVTCWNRRLCCLDFHGVNVRHATRSAFKDILDIKVIKPSRSDEPHNSSAAWATRRPRRVITKMFVAHGRQRSLNRKCPRHLSRDVFGPVDKSSRVQDNRLFCCATKPKHRREVVNKGTRNLVSDRVFCDD
jgi:hypothetical protein